MKLPPELRTFVEETSWTFAKTYAKTWPHEYIVRDRVVGGLFLPLVRHIREHGYEANFYRKPITYFEEDGLVYWTMGAPIEETTIVNRCKKEATYEERLKSGTLPPERGEHRPHSDTGNQDPHSMRRVDIDPDFLTNLQSLFHCEGCVVYTVLAPDGTPCLFVDEGIMADFVSEEEGKDMIFQSVYAFDSETERDEYARNKRWIR